MADDGLKNNINGNLTLLHQRNEQKHEDVRNTLEKKLGEVLLTTVKNSGELRDEVMKNSKDLADVNIKTLSELGNIQQTHLQTVSGGLKDLSLGIETKIESLRTTIDSHLKNLQEGNEKKLDEMRRTVDEKLHETLEKRLGDSFKLVSERLEAVQRGLGEMQSLATGVGDLKKVLMNVKTRGTLGEVQLGAILEQILNPDQYSKNVKTRPSSGELVEFAINLPGTDSTPGNYLYLPIDSKFPQEDYLRLVEAAEATDPEGVQEATRSLIRAVKKSAEEICRKYIEPPYTTDFAILFLPTEGLYAEVMRQPGLFEQLHMSCKVVVAGPSTLAAILSSFRMGFRTLAIEKRASEVWEVLSAVKVEFGKFGDHLAKVKKQLDTASQSIDQTTSRTKAMERKLRSVEGATPEASAALFALPISSAVKVLPDS